MAAKTVNSVDQGKSTPRCHAGVTPFKVDLAFDTTVLDEADDTTIVIGPFDTNTHLYDLKIRVTDMDTNGSPALVFDVSAVDVAGTVSATLIDGSTIGQGGGIDELDATQTFPSIGGKYLAVVIDTAAATAAAGTGTLWGLAAGGLQTHASSSLVTQ